MEELDFSSVECSNLYDLIVEAVLVCVPAFALEAVHLDSQSLSWYFCVQI